MAFKIMASDNGFHLINEDVGEPDIFINPISKGMFKITCQNKVVGRQAPTQLRATLLKQALYALVGTIPANDWNVAQSRLYTAARQCMSN